MSFPSLSNQLHSFHQPIAPNGLFLTTPIPSRALKISKDQCAAEIVICHYPVIDQPRFPEPGPCYQATVSVRIVWCSEGPHLHWGNAAENYRIVFQRARAQIECTAEVPALGFRFTSALLHQSASSFAMMGTERNGVFY